MSAFSFLLLFSCFPWGKYTACLCSEYVAHLWLVGSSSFRAIEPFLVPYGAALVVPPSFTIHIPTKKQVQWMIAFHLAKVTLGLERGKRGQRENIWRGSEERSPVPCLLPSVLFCPSPGPGSCVLSSLSR